MYLIIKLSKAVGQGQPFPEEVRRTYGLQRAPIRWLAEEKKAIIGQVGRGKGQ